MTQPQSHPAGAARNIGLGLSVIWLAAFSLRTGLIGVGPILPDLRGDLGLSGTQASLLVALPVALMGFAAIPGGKLADRFGSRSVITAGLVLLSVAGALRGVVPGYALLLLMTILFGAGIGIAQPAFPRLARGLVPANIGKATGVYAAGLFAGSVVAAFLTAPVLMGNHRSWRFPLIVWGALAGVATIAWIASLRRWQAADERLATRSPLTPAGHWSPWRDRQAWIVAAIAAGQGVAYYLMVAWLLAVYQELGISTAHASLHLLVLNLATFPAMVFLPPLSDRLGSRRIPTMVSAVAFLVAAFGLVLAPLAPGLTWLWPALAGFGVAGMFSMSLLMPTDVAPLGRTGEAAGMILAVCYIGSSAGPVIGGVIKDRTGSFASALDILPLIGIVMVVLCWFVPKPGALTLVATEGRDDVE